MAVPPRPPLGRLAGPVFCTCSPGPEGCCPASCFAQGLSLASGSGHGRGMDSGVRIVGPVGPGAQAACSILSLKWERGNGMEARALPQQVYGLGCTFSPRPDSPSLPDNSLSKPSSPRPFYYFVGGQPCGPRGNPIIMPSCLPLNSSLIHLLRNNLQRAPH